MHDFQIKKTFSEGRVVVAVGDITVQRVDAIVNAANSSLMGGGGVDGAIHRRGGPQILEECRRVRRAEYPEGLPTGKAVMTTGGNLHARYVIHTVGPVYGRHDGHEAELLEACYKNSLALAVERGLRTIAFPAISTGIFGYPRNEAAAVASKAIEEFLASDSSIEEIYLVFFSPGDADLFLNNHRFKDDAN